MENVDKKEVNKKEETMHFKLRSTTLKRGKHVNERQEKQASEISFYISKAVPLQIKLPCFDTQYYHVGGI